VFRIYNPCGVFLPSVQNVGVGKEAKCQGDNKGTLGEMEQAGQGGFTSTWGLFLDCGGAGN